jgi:hypothetical protein
MFNRIRCVIARLNESDIAIAIWKTTWIMNGGVIVKIN